VAPYETGQSVIGCHCLCQFFFFVQGLGAKRKKKTKKKENNKIIK
jgi:hypothetical protein